MKLKYLLSLLVLFGFFTFSYEQVEHCGQPEMTKALWEEHPEIKVLEEQINEQLMAASEASGTYEAKDNTVYIIPIVFHVLHEYGTEDISDAQIYDQMRILNEDFRKLNSDTSEIVPYFQNVAGDAKIEFRLATIDPFGNPTNGITRHFTSETKVGDDFSKLEQWPRNRYLNVWVTHSMASGLAGYAYYPSGAASMSFRDGVIILNRHIGSIGSATPYNSRSLTHEIGHYLNLYHPWGSTNNPGLAINCNTDDGVTDTPNTIGSTVGVCNKGLTTCDDTLDNVQNFMDYSYCSVMFTDGQIIRMRNALNSNVSQRSNLWTQSNLDNTIPDNIIYNPVADFFADNLVTCVGDPVQFENFSWRLSDTIGNNATYLWEFEDGDVATSTQKNPIITFTSQGWKDVTLTIHDNGRTNTITKENFLWVGPNWSPFSGKVHFDFNDNPNYWVIENPQNHPFQWEVKNDAGKNGTGGIFLNMMDPFDNPLSPQDQYFYENRRGSTESTFISQPIDLSYMTNISVTFDYACATEATTPADIKEELWIYSSNNCGKTWSYRKKLSGSTLVNNGFIGTSFYPDNNTQWDNISFNIPEPMAGDHVLLKFKYIGSDKSNNIAIDNINIDGILGTDTYQKNDRLSVYPNPSNNNLGWNINYDPSEWGGAQIVLTDIQGRIVTTGELPKNQSKWNIKPSLNAVHGVYFLKVTNHNKTIQNKLVLE